MFSVLYRVIGDSMKVVVVDNERFDLSRSLLHEELNNSDIDTSLLLGDAFIKGGVVLDSHMTVLPMVSEWLTYDVRYNKISPRSARTYGKNIGYFIEYLASHPVYKRFKRDDAFLEIEEHTILEYITYMRDELVLETSTIRNRDATIRKFFDYLCDSRGNKPALRDDNPYADGFISSSAKSKRIEMCSIDELIGLLLSTKSERERALVQFMFDSGVRRSEVCKISKKQFIDALNHNRQSFIEDDFTIQVPTDYKPFYIEGVKGRRRETKPRESVVSITALLRVQRYHSSPLYRRESRKFGPNAPAFLNAQGRAFTPSSISKLYSRLSKRAINQGYIDRSIHPHMMRHAFAGSVLRSPDLGKDAVERLLTVKECLGHCDLSTTQIYTSLPYDIYGTLCGDDGEILTRAAIMERVAKKTKLKIDLRGQK